MKPRLIAGNWKMHNTAAEAVAFVRQFRQALVPHVSAEVLILPPFTSLHGLQEVLRPDDRFSVGAQDLHWESEGAYTGAISGLMLNALGCRAVLIGHSERRRLFGETNAHVNKKLKAALRHNLAPILCVGETLEEREAGHTESVVKAQLLHGLRDVSADHVTDVTIAYEPVWAIGTGRAATVQQAEEVHACLRAILHAEWADAGTKTRIIYGGSVSPHNAREFFESDEINGALVGSACLEPEGFAKICELAS